MESLFETGEGLLEKARLAENGHVLTAPFEPPSSRRHLICWSDNADVNSLLSRRTKTQIERPRGEQTRLGLAVSAGTTKLQPRCRQFDYRKVNGHRRALKGLSRDRHHPPPHHHLLPRR